MAGKISIHVELEPGLSYSKTADIRRSYSYAPEEIEHLAAKMADILSKSVAAVYGDARKDSK